jgi:hypothetical protein
VFAGALAAGVAQAQTVIERLVSPGPLSTPHANLEGRCNACHEAFDRSAQSELCASCHRSVAADRAAHTGFHGRDSRAASQACRSCHTDHEGRGADIVGLERRSFNHTVTDYPLRGAHVRVACASCHVAGRRHRDAPTACVDCHRADEPHRGRLGVRCSSCHNEDAWRSVRFDHSETRFPLSGAHLATRCTACHANERYDGTPTTCVSCHREDDAHRGGLGADCSACHTPAGWRSARFNHARTGFPLRGRHAAIECRTCHARPAGQVRLASDCASCHRDDDARAHQGRNGAACQECHSESEWRTTTFDHARATRFPLRGAHARAACASCHVRPAREVRLDVACASCHRDDDAHAGQEGAQCGDCHGETSWTQSVRFDHGIGAFPLIGAHAQAECSACHATPRFRDAPTACVECHQDDDRHQTRLGRDCATCHVPVAWANWAFDHDTQTEYRLTGAHVGLQCEACHTASSRDGISQSSACIACHRADDVHRGEFGSECGRCHTTESFSEPRL